MNRRVVVAYNPRVTFAPALSELCRAVPGARGAVFVDHEGEAIQHVVHDATLEPYDLQVAGAHAAPLVAHGWAPRRLALLGREGMTFIHVVTENYAIVLLAAADTRVYRVRPALERCAAQLLAGM